MERINDYGTELSNEDILLKKHRAFVGGMWDEIGNLQFDFMVQRGLLPSSKLADIGCGALRGGVHFIKYLDSGNYYGLDLNESLINAGYQEIKEYGLDDKKVSLLVDDQFRIGSFNEQFDFMLSVSLFTHLPMNHIIRCLFEAGKNLKPQGVYYSSFFEAPTPCHIDELLHEPGGIRTFYDRDPFHYSFDEVVLMASVAQLRAELLGDWGHPRSQRMAAFYKR